MNKNIIIAIIVIVIGIGAIVIAALVRAQPKNSGIDIGDTQENTQTKVIPTPTTSPLIKIGALETSIPLQIIEPQDKAVVNKSSVIVKGKTAPKAEVSVNDKDTVADVSGNFSVALTLEEGENPILIVANDAEGNATESEIIVMYEVKE